MSESRTALDQSNAPARSAPSKSPDSTFACATFSTATIAARRTTSASISSAVGRFDPAAFTCVPGNNCAPKSTGSLAVVIVIATCAWASMLATSFAGSTGICSNAVISSQNVRARAGSRP